MKNKVIIVTLLCCLQSCLQLNAYAAIDSAEQLINSGDNQKAEKILLAATKDKQTALAAWLKLSELALTNNDPDKAEDHVENALDINPNNAQTHFVLAQVMAAQAQASSIFSAPGYAKKSLKAFKKAVELEPDSTLYRKALMSFYLNAPGIVGGDNDKALAQAKGILKLDEQEGLVAQLQVFLAEEDQTQIQNTLKQINAKYPTNTSSQLYYGFYLQENEKWAPALAAFNHIIAQKAQTKQQISTKNRALYQLGKTAVLSKSNQQQGIEALQTYIAQTNLAQQLPGKDWAEYRMALLHQQQGETQKAQKIYRRLLSSSSDKQLLKMLKKQL